MSSIRRVFVAAGTVLVTGCSNSLGLSGSGGNIVGMWTVVSVNSSPMPVLLPAQNGCAQTGLSGTLEVTADGRFSAAYSYEGCRFRGFKETINRRISGRYTQNGGDLVFSADSGFSKFATAPLVGGTISGSVLVLQSTPAPGMTVSMALERR
jgi:hypothetical protein